MQVPDAYGAALDNTQARRVEQSGKLGGLDMAVTLMKVREKPLLLISSSEINDEYTTARLQNPAHLADAIFTDLARQMVKHQRTQHGIELCICKRQRLDNFVSKVNLQAGLSRLLAGPGYHLPRCVNPTDF